MLQLLRVTAWALGLIACSVSSYGAGTAKGKDGFTISLAESGEVILADEHIASYDWDKHRMSLTAQGGQRWQSFVKFNDSFDPPIRQLSDLHGAEFVVRIGGVRIYSGHFLSVVSSVLPSGVALYDCLGVPEDEVWMTFTQPVDGSSTEDPRFRPEIEAYFRGQGKLVRSD